MERHVVRISKDGRKVEVKVEGVKGSSCKEATRGLEQALGTVTEDVATEEMYATAEDVQTQDQA